MSVEQDELLQSVRRLKVFCDALVDALGVEPAETTIKVSVRGAETDKSVGELNLKEVLDTAQSLIDRAEPLTKSQSGKQQGGDR